MDDLVYTNLFWLFMFGNVFGVLIEGIWCKIRYGKWETHTVTIWGPFNVVYGIGVPMFFATSIYLDGVNWLLKFCSMAIVGSVVEYFCGMVIRIGVGMKGWDYSDHFMNIHGIISLKMVGIWGVAGLAFNQILFEPLKMMTGLLTGRGWNLLCMFLTMFMVVNLIYTAICIIRWSNRHRGYNAANTLTRWIDVHYPDHIMNKKYFYWSFLDD